MKKLIRYSKEYTRKMNLLDFSLLKFCLCSIGVLIGLAVPGQHKKKTAVGASAVFALTYAPLMAKYLASICSSRQMDRELAQAPAPEEIEE